MCWITWNVVRIYDFCSGHPFWPTTSDCECPTSLFKSTLLSKIDTIFLLPLYSVLLLYSLEYICRSLSFPFLLTASPFPLCCYHNKHTRLHTVSQTSLLRAQNLILAATCPLPTKYPPTTNNSSSNVSRTSTKTDWYPSFPSSQLIFPNIN